MRTRAIAMEGHILTWGAPYFSLIWIQHMGELDWGLQWLGQNTHCWVGLLGLRHWCSSYRPSPLLRLQQCFGSKWPLAHLAFTQTQIRPIVRWQGQTTWPVHVIWPLFLSVPVGMPIRPAAIWSWNISACRNFLGPLLCGEDNWACNCLHQSLCPQQPLQGWHGGAHENTQLLPSVLCILGNHDLPMCFTC